MKTDLEQRFFEAFELGGVADSCMRLAIEWLDDEEEPQEWRRSDDERKRRVIEETNKFDFSIINTKRLAPIFQEIQTNLHLLADRARESYIYGLLTPFKDWVRIVNGRADEGESEWCKERLKHQAEQIFKILNGDYVRDTIEGALQKWSSIVINYSNRLDAILLQEGEDLLRYQQITGVRLIEYRDLSALDYYCGSVGVARKYIADLTPTTHPGTSTGFSITDLVIDTSTGATAPEGWRLPSELDTPEAWEIWRQAQERGLISKDFRWLKGKQLLACFAREMSLRFHLGKGVNSDGSKRINWKIFEDLFKIERGKLRNNYNDIQKTGEEPSDINIINEIFGL